MSQKSFKDFFLENMLDFLWRQWSALGVAGGARTEEGWIIDPEALLVFSLEMARYEPRLFDEILDWLVVNGTWIDIQRLRGIIRSKDEKTQMLVKAAARYTAGEARSLKRKWLALAHIPKGDSTIKQEMLFRTKEGSPYPKPREAQPELQHYGFLRENFSVRRMSKAVPVTAGCTIRFVLRSLFGLGSRSECILYLLTHEAGHPAEVARAIGISVRGVQDALIELAASGLVLTRTKGKRKIEYWLSQKRWWEFLSAMNIEDMKIPLWLDWIALYSALMSVWKILQEIEGTESAYMRSSKLREAMESISAEFSKSRLELPPVPGSSVRPENYEEEFRGFVRKVMGREEEGK